MPFKCPGAPNEAAMLLEYDCRKRGSREKISVDLYTAEPGPMPVAGAAVSAALRQMIESKGIGYHPNHAVTAVDPALRRITFANGADAEFDLLAYIPPHRAPQPVRDAGLCGESGWIPVDRETMATKFPGVFALGDIAGIMLTSIGKPLPKAGVLAHYEAEVVAHNIVCAITGKGTSQRFAGNGECFLEAGDGRAGYGGGNFYADEALTGRHAGSANDYACRACREMPDLARVIESLLPEYLQHRGRAVTTARHQQAAAGLRIAQ